jgi:hypothetical protein
VNGEGRRQGNNLTIQGVNKTNLNGPNKPVALCMERKLPGKEEDELAGKN